MKEKIVINKTNMYKLAIIVLFTSRLLEFFKIPSMINFVHFLFIIIGILCALVKGIKIKGNLVPLIFFISVEILFSGVINFICIFNSLLLLLIIIEPFIIINDSLYWNEKSLIFIENFLIIISLLNLVLSYFQYFVLGYIDDDVRGIFLGMGSGAHINGAFAILMSIYVMYLNFKYKKENNSLIKFAPLLYSILQLVIVILCDNKQSILAFGFSAIILVIISSYNIKRTFKLMCGIIIISIIVYILSFSVLHKIRTWTSNENSMILGFNEKISFFNILNSYDNSITKKLFGFGSGMTLSRVARLLPEYSKYKDFGITISPITNMFKRNYLNSWIMVSSSLWTYYFSWAAFYGDIGILGVILISCLYWKVYKQFCKSSLVSKWLLISMIVHGLLFDWLEEPNFVVAYFLIIILINNNLGSNKKRIWSKYFCKNERFE